MGRLLTWLIANPAVFVGFVGWFVTAVGWFVSQGAQRRLFVHQVKNSARLEIVAAIRKRQDVLNAMTTKILFLEIENSGPHPIWSATQWRRWIDSFAPVMEQARATEGEWVCCMEQYEVLFRKTASCRRQLISRQIAVIERLTRWWLSIRDEQDRASGVIEEAASVRDLLSNEASLLEDLLVYLQNVTLGAVVGHAVEFRKPLDTTVPRIIVGKNGELQLINVEPSVASRMRGITEMSRPDGTAT